jgi:2-methylcitrate dehydratase
MTVAENPAYTASYQDTTRGANPNSIEVRFKDGTTTGLIEVEYPIGHPRRRKEGIPLLIGKFRGNLARRYPPARVKAIEALCMSRAQLERMPVNAFTDMLQSKVESRKSKVSRSKR